MTLSCRRAVELASQELDSPLPINKKFALVAHRIICSACRRFRKQLVEIDHVSDEFLTAEEAEGAVLSDDSKTNIKTLLREAAKDEKADPR